MNGKENREQILEDFKNMWEQGKRYPSFDDKALEKFIRKPEKLSLYDKIKLKLDVILLTFLFVTIFIASMIGTNNCTMESYVGIPIMVLSILGIIVLIKTNKKDI